MERHMSTIFDTYYHTIPRVLNYQISTKKETNLEVDNSSILLVSVSEIDKGRGMES